MKHASFLLVFLLLLSIELFAQKVCNSCPGHAVYMDSTLTKTLRDGYKNNYKTEIGRKILPESVEFSDSSIMKFVNSNFGADNVHSGVNVYFMVYGKKLRRGQSEALTTGLMLVPRFTEACKPDSAGYIVSNNAFDLPDTIMEMPDSIYELTPKEVLTYQEQYRLKYPRDKSKYTHYTRYIYFDKEVFIKIRDFFVANNEYTTLRFYFINYKQEHTDICGYKNEKQLTLAMVPTKKGRPDFNAFKDLLTTYHAKGILSLNHGSLCPNYCPDGDTR